MGTKPNVFKEAITTPIEKKNIDTVNKTEKSQAPNKKQIHPSAINLKKLNHWINQGILKLLIQKTQLIDKIHQGLFQKLFYLKKVPKQKKPQKQILVFIFFLDIKKVYQV